MFCASPIVCFTRATVSFWIFTEKLIKIYNLMLCVIDDIYIIERIDKRILIAIVENDYLGIVYKFVDAHYEFINKIRSIIIYNHKQFFHTFIPFQ